jgi:hypothetical protein
MSHQRVTAWLDRPAAGIQGSERDALLPCGQIQRTGSGATQPVLIGRRASRPSAPEGSIIAQGRPLEPAP